MWTVFFFGTIYRVELGSSATSHAAEMRLGGHKKRASHLFAKLFVYI
jgi:hypothetical protein